jgi:preprotein translocase subunit SecA
LGLEPTLKKNPKNEYKREAYALFEEMLNLIDTETIRILFNLKLQAEENIPELKPQNTQDMILEHASPQPEGNIEHTNNKNQQPHQDKITNPITRSEPKIGRNDFVKITNGKETKELKYKKAQSLIETGEWKII